ncbi:hypothetical protein C8T65DRAFT_832814 [Cerioporus squamosus]|nr:hypothetical protein C8T65DRAFT_832814 [Cerioporus squamosus]
MSRTSVFPNAASHKAMMCYDVVCSTFETLREGLVEEDSNAVLCRAALGACAVVCRAWSQPALRCLWKRLPSIVPILHIFAPDDIPCPPLWDIIPEDYAEKVIATQLYKNRASGHWDRFTLYSTFIDGLTWRGHYNLTPTFLELLGFILAYSPKGTFLPRLRTLAWTPTGMWDASFIALTGSQVRELVLRYPTFVFGRHPWELDDPPRVDDTQLQAMLGRLKTSSPLVESLRVDSPLSPAGLKLCQTIASFEHIREVDLAFSIDTSSFIALASLSHIASIKVHRLFTGNTLETQIVTCSQLHTLAVSGDCACLTDLLGIMRLPSLRMAYLAINEHSILSPPSAPDYPSCVAAFANATDPTNLEWLTISLGKSGVQGFMKCARRTVLIDLLGPLLPFTALRHFELASMVLYPLPNGARPSCSWSTVLDTPFFDMVKFASSNSDFEAMARAWTKLEYLSLESLVWYSDRPGSYEIPTAAILHHFWRHCPNLRELCLPYLDILHDDPAQLPTPTTEHSTHPLTYLRVDACQWEQGRVELCYEEQQDKDYATYLLRLFPRLDKVECCRFVAAKESRGEAGWGRVFRRVYDKESLDKVLQRRIAVRPRARETGLWDGDRICRPPWPQGSSA